MPRSELIGYVRKSKNGQALKLSLSKEALENSETYSSADGHIYISLIMNLDRVDGIIKGERDVTSICQLLE